MSDGRTRIDISGARGVPAGSLSGGAVPRYSLYGDATSRRGWTLNIEPLDRRARDRDWTILPHVHSTFTQLVFVAKGGGTMSIDGEECPFEAPCVLVVPTFHVHGFGYRDPSDGIVLTMEDSYLAEVLVRAGELTAMLRSGGAFALSAPAWRRIAAGLKNLTAELALARAGQAIAAEIQVLQLLLSLLRDRPPECRPGAPERGEVVERFLSLVERRFRDRPSVAELASEIAMTHAQLRKACRASTGMLPLSILHDRVLAEAKRCLAYTSMSIAEIAYSMGYDDVAYFTRFFTKKIGISPSAFRRARCSSI